MFFGLGILRGMNITLMNFIRSYTRKRGSGEIGALTTVQYPEERLPEKEKFRNFPFLIYDDKPEDLRCVACDICAQDCPPRCIYIVKDTDEAGKPMKKPAVFDIDFTVCMNCGICEEVCPFDAIFMDHEFEIADSDRHDKLLYHRDDLLKTNEHFHKIRPNDGREVDTRLAEAKEAKAKKDEARKKAAEAKAAAKAKAEAEKAKEDKPPETEKESDPQ
ncbi:MAG: NADH-quinone oxidoreductase subunit I [Planctomycetes bacterium]|nr:NADH-quinone oxidoreductase subunit I [Planctomycetota bacterium]